MKLPDNLLAGLRDGDETELVVNSLLHRVDGSGWPHQAGKPTKGALPLVAIELMLLALLMFPKFA